MGLESTYGQRLRKARLDTFYNLLLLIDYMGPIY